jgi:hypothetical protein
VEKRRSDDPNAVVVPPRPGPLRAFGREAPDRDEVDELLDDVLGEPDQRGPGLADAALIVGGAALVVNAQLASWPAITTVAGAAAVLLGLVLPIRSLWRRLEPGRRDRRSQTLLGEGTLLRTDSVPVRDLVAAHGRLEAGAAPLSPSVRAEVAFVAHGALSEVASLLEGRSPTTAIEIDYIEARRAALDDLATTLADPRVGDGDASRRRALVEARREVEEIAGTSSVSAAAELARRLRGSEG